MIVVNRDVVNYDPNIGNIDRFARFALAVSIFGLIMALYKYNLLTTDYVLVTLLTIPLVTSAIMRWDPLYAVLRIHTLASDLWFKPEIKTPDFQPNLSVPRRVMRVLMAAAMIVLPIAYAGETMTWEPFVILASIPLVLTAILGWGPIEAMVKDEPTHKRH
ncbi:MAG: DUF2892 domain-containing protein [Pseudomonadota bacterium]